MRPIRIFHTNDLHSHFEAMPKIAHFFNKKRKEYGEREILLFVDLGDHLDRSHPLTEVSVGFANREILEASGYQSVTLGNNEGITLTKEELNHLYQGSSYQVIVSNLRDLDTLEYPRWATPYKILDLDGFRLGMIGLTAPYKEYYRLLGWQVETAEEVLPELVSRLAPQVDLLILLSHLGLANDRLIAENYPEIGLILGGHSHHYLPEGEWIGNTLIVQMGRNGGHVGEVLIEPQRTNHPSLSFQIGATSFSIEGEEEDGRIMGLIEQYGEKAERLLDREIIYLKEGLPLHWEKESPFANLLAQSVRHWTHTEISLVNAGLLLDSLPPGSATQKDLLRVCPHPINTCVISLRALELKEIIEEALQPVKMRQRVRGFGFRGEILGFPVLDGCEVVVEGGEVPKVVGLYAHGKPLSPHAEIRLGTIDMFMFLKPYHALEKELSPEFFLPDFLRHLLAVEMHREGALEEAWHPRFHWVEGKK
ncbi:Metallophosphoesterase [[Clostridium] ultunense Esp]|uniref:bifunctional metallophosphatase/5'-nucleotidase n=1 Tax=Thermicanus aegyptius TaxID=94009 RepID=UPI0002B70525|nr:metallophosphoesterase [Thermicanus aegyptius]CCQ97674.1 Metallophosphoesterase [[Clostridium] ultunense Esp]